MSIKYKYQVKPIDSFLCRDWCLNKHYAKRLPPIEYAFGLFASDGTMHGIVTYGTPVSSTLRGLWDDVFKLMELNRLVVNDGMCKNVLSYFVSASLSMLPKPLVIASYADTSQGHHGYIYQATNWVYTGLSAKFVDYHVKGMEHMHHTSLTDFARGKENRMEYLKARYGDDLVMIDRPRKHRYFYFVGTRKQVAQMRSMLPYKVEPYPKGDNKRYDASYTPNTQTQLF